MREYAVRMLRVFVCVGLCVSSPSSIFSCDTHNKLWKKTIPKFIWLIFQANGFGRLRSLFVPTIFYLLRKSKCLWWPEVKSRTLPSQQSTGFVWWWLGVKPSRPSYSKRARKKMRIWRNTMLCMWCNLYRRYILLWAVGASIGSADGILNFIESLEWLKTPLVRRFYKCRRWEALSTAIHT